MRGTSLRYALDRRNAGEVPRMDKLADIPRRCLEALGLVSKLAKTRRAPWSQHVDEYTQELRTARRNATYIANTERCLRAAGEGCKWTALDDVNRRDFTLYLGRRKERDGVSARTLNNIRATVVSFVEWLVQTERADANPITGIKRIDETDDRRRRRRAFADGEAIAILKAASVREFCYRLGFGTGLRRRELRELQWRDVRIDGADADRPYLQLRAEATKSKRADWVPLQRYLAKLLREARPAGCSPTDRVLPRVPTFETWKKDVGRAGLAYRDDGDDSILGFHSLRVTVSTNLRVAGRPQTEIDAIMRHRRSDVGSQSYTDLRAFDLFAAIECLPEYDIGRSESLRMTGTEDAGQAPRTPANNNRTQNRTQRPAQGCTNLHNSASAAGISATSAALSASASCAQKTPCFEGYSARMRPRQTVPLMQH